MNKTLKAISHLIAVVSIFFLAGCNSPAKQDEGFSTDSAAIAKGKSIFNQNCVACHSIKQDGIGPALGGITQEVSAEWLVNFIKDPKGVIESGDDRAKRVFDRYKAMMPSFAYYKEDELQGIVAFLHTQKAPDQRLVVKRDVKPLENPIPEGIPMSDLVVNMKLFTQMPATSEQKPLARITKYFPRPDTKEFFVLDLRGKLYRLTNGKAEVYLDISQYVPNFINAPGHATGFGSFAFHPEYAKNGLLYTTHTEKAGSAKADFAYEDSLGVKLQWVISEWKTEQPAAFPFEGKRRELFRVNMVGQSHGVQDITFNPLSKRGDEDYGLLYIGIGDGGSAERGILHINKGPENIWSSIVRIDPAGRNSVNGHYGIPKSNPFVNSKNPKALGEVYAYGFRNPHKITWTRSGKMLASNIGQHQIEELNLILPGHNYGWPLREGSFEIYLKENTRWLYPLPPDDEANNFDYPIAEYDHDEGNAIIGGYEYQGNTIPQLKGKYLFGDMVNGRLFYVNVDDIKEGEKSAMKEFHISLDGKRTSFKELCDDERLSMRFGRDAEGEIYISTMPDGKVYKLVR
jgi:glucose/arabinose dehydrogenase/mono/diheme cytochrome c family protein